MASGPEASPELTAAFGGRVGVLPVAQAQTSIRGRAFSTLCLWSSTRMLRDCRFIYTPDLKTPSLIDDAIDDELDREGEEYKAVFDKARNWRKNWFNRFIVAAKGLVKE